MYVDWSVPTTAGRRLEVGDADGAASVELTWGDLERLHAQLGELLASRT